MDVGDDKLKVAAAQIFPGFLDKERNLSKVEEFLNKSAKAGVELTVFPECALTGYVISNLREVKEVAEPVPGPSTQRIESACRRLGCWAVIGLVESLEGRFYNTAILIGPGGLAGKHQKVHIPYLGLDRFSTPGKGPIRLYETAIGKIGLAVCYDVFFPETARVLTLMGLELLVVSTNWVEGVEFYVDYLSRTRAIENRINLVVANRVGEENGFKFYGRSQIVDYTGKILAEGGGHEELIISEVDMVEPGKKHIVRIPGVWETDCIRDRRPELYKLISFRMEE